MNVTSPKKNQLLTQRFTEMLTLKFRPNQNCLTALLSQDNGVKASTGA